MHTCPLNLQSSTHTHTHTHTHTTTLASVHNSNWCRPAVLTPTPYLEVIVQSKQSEFVLQMYPEVHVLWAMHHYVDEVHEGHLMVHQVARLPEVMKELLEAILFPVHPLEVVSGLDDLLVTPLDQTDGSKEVNNHEYGAEWSMSGMCVWRCGCVRCGMCVECGCVRCGKCVWNVDV